MSSETTMTCANCGNEEPEGTRFCGNCGTPLGPPDREPALTAASSGTTLTCASCGNEEPEGTRFCGNCGTPLGPPDRELAHTASVAPATPAPADQGLPPVEPPAASPQEEKRRVPWIAAGAAVALLVAGGAAVAVLLLTGGGDASEATPTEQQPLPTTTSEPPPPASSPTLADRIAPSFEVLAASQEALSARIRTLRAGTESFAALHEAAASLAASVAQTQASIDGLAPGDTTEAATLSLLRRALATHLAYAEAITRFPARPRSFTGAQAREAIALAGEAEVAYARLAFADPTLPSLFISRSGNSRLLAVVPASKPATPITALRVIDLVSLLVGIRPDDPLGGGRCFGPYSPRASLTVSGVVHRSGFIQCGDDANGDPSRASGLYRFSGPTFRAGSSLARVTGQVAIDESSSSSQRGSSVTWTVLYDGRPVCSATVVWAGSRPTPRGLDCRISPSVSAGRFDLHRLRIQQVASLASSGSFWAGLLDPTIVVELPG